MILPDTSAWIEYIRRTESAADWRLTRAFETGESLATMGPIRLEVLAGARGDDSVQDLASLLDHAEQVPVDEPLDYESAAAIYRACRADGHTIGSLTDCLIAAVALRTGAELLHCDADFDRIAERVPLRVVGLD